MIFAIPVPCKWSRAEWIGTRCNGSWDIDRRTECRDVGIDWQSKQSSRPVFGGGLRKVSCLRCRGASCFLSLYVGLLCRVLRGCTPAVHGKVATQGQRRRIPSILDKVGRGDQCKVRERLRKIANLPLGHGVVLLGEQTQMVLDRQQPLEQLFRFV